MTTHNFKRESKRKSFFDPEALMNVLQQIVIVFLSAMLAMWLTEYVDEKSTVEHVQAFISPIQDTSVSELSSVSFEIKTIHDAKDGAEGTDEELLRIIDVILKEENVLFETMIYNENFVATLEPMSYMILNDDVESKKSIKRELSDITVEDIDREKTVELIAEYLYLTTDAVIAMDYLAKDVQFGLLNLTMVSDVVYANNIYYDMYQKDITMLETLFFVDMTEWERIRRYN